MIGFTGGGTTFKDKAALLNGDKIGNFDKPADAIDLTDVNFGSSSQTFVEDGGGTFGTLSVTDGTHHAAIVLFGNFMAAGFHTANDGGGGTQVTYIPPSSGGAFGLLAAHV
jgi:hypothetical protein